MRELWALEIGARFVAAWPGVSRYVVLFAVYAFAGWLVEVLYRSAMQRRFVNPGFLVGPFVPTYGVGALLVVGLDAVLGAQPMALRVLAFGIVLTAFEYVAGVVAERMFHLKLWDYSENRFNLHGRVCASFSLVWTASAWVFVAFVHPLASTELAALAPHTVSLGALVAIGYFAVDLAMSAVALTSLRARLVALYTDYVAREHADVGDVFASFRRLFDAFPHLNRLAQQQIYAGIREKLGGTVDRVGRRLHDRLDTVRPDREEYARIVQDILEHPEFQRLGDFPHHDASILDHVKKVSYRAYKICKALGLDYRSAARGGLLHDFFLYDWRHHDVPDLPKEKFHGFAHPAIALGNAEKHFELNDVERDIILRHMWPLTLMPPRYLESFVVTFADKAIASQEAAALLGARLRRSVRRRSLRRRLRAPRSARRDS